MQSNRRWSPLIAAALAGVLATGTIAASAQPSRVLAPPVLSAATDDVCEGATPDAFRDVPGANRHVANIDCIAAFGVVLGVGGGNYDPTGDVTRGQMASFLVSFTELARGEAFSPPSVVTFTDIAGTTHGSNVGIAAELGITSGLTSETYGPRAAVTRQQMASFVAQAIQAAGGTLAAEAADAFADDDGSTHESNIDLLAAAGIVSGIGGGEYAPNATVSRAQMATFLANSIRLLHEQDVWGADPLIEPDPSIPPDPDVASVKRATSDRDDQLDIVWNTSITFTGSSSDLAVYAATTDDLVASATALSTVNGDTFRITLDGDLQGDATYRLRAETDLAENAAGASNDRELFMFVFSESGGAIAPEFSGIAVDGEPVASGVAISTEETAPVVSGTASAPGQSVDAVQYRTDGGTWANAVPDDGAYDSETEAFQVTLAGLDLGTHGVEMRARGDDGALSSVYVFDLTIAAIPPTIESVVTDPDENRLKVTFSEPVTCPSGMDAQGAWSFGNLRTGGPATKAVGAPALVSQPAVPSPECYLVFPDPGIVNGDFGLLDYSEPPIASDRVQGGAADLRSAANVDVADGVAPSMVSVTMLEDPSKLRLTFDEAINCATLSDSDLRVWDGEDPVVVSSTECLPTFSSEVSLDLVSDASSEAAISVLVWGTAAITDESGDNVVPRNSIIPDPDSA